LLASLLAAPAALSPQLISASSLNGSSIGVCFSEPLQPASATTMANYRLIGGAVVTGVTLRPDGQSVALTVGGFSGTNFTLSVSNILTAGGTPIPGSTISGRVSGLTAGDLGGAADAGSTFTCAAGRFEIVAGGY